LDLGMRASSVTCVMEYACWFQIGRDDAHASSESRRITKPLLETNEADGKRGSFGGQFENGVRATTISVAKSPSTSATTGSSLPVPLEAGALKMTFPVLPS